MRPSRDVDARLGLAMVIAGIIGALASLATMAPGAEVEQRWQWSHSAPHHQSVVLVSCAEAGSPNVQAQTSGVYVRYQDLEGVLTVAHVFSPRMPTTVTFSDGTTQVGQTTIDKFEHDLGFIFVQNSAIQPMTIATIAPRAGDHVEFVTVGGPEGRLRHWYARLTSVSLNEIRSDAYVIGGDSGGALLNQRNELVGIQSLGVREQLTGGGWAVVRGSGSPGYSVMGNFLGRVSDCQARGECGPNATPAVRGGGDLYPPPPTPSDIADLPPPAPRPMVPVASPLDYDRLAELIYAKIQLDAAKFQGPIGPPGPAGIPGSSTAIDYEQILRGLPPVQMEIEHPDGSVYRQAKPLGEAIRLRLVPQ